MNRFKDTEHLLRFAALFVIAFVAFLIIRHFVVPKTFGEYGHYRGAAIGEIAARPVKFVGHQAYGDCEACHSDILAAKKTGKHAGVNCEACHGPLQTHLDAMTKDGAPQITPPKLDTAVLCIRCHAASAAKPKDFPQVDADQHAGGVPCETCHQPHSPAIQAGGAK
jgi:transcription elongation factor Elf1